MKQIAVFGGTFNPIHRGHINLCLECAKHFRFDRILLMPSNIPPHKIAHDLASNEHRLNMCRLAAACDPIFEVSDLEMCMSGVSYTVHTVERLRQEYPDAELYLIVGSDMLFTFHHWYRYADILEQVHLVAGAREPEEYRKMVEYAKAHLQDGLPVYIVHIPVLTISSTQIRDALHLGEPIDRYLDAQVYEYIVKNQLYR